jgi:L-fucose mutarotase
MLKGIPPILSPHLLKTIAEMGHGDELVLADGNFPAESMGQRTVRADGHGNAELLEAILTLYPIDTFQDDVVLLMQKVPGHDIEVPIWDTFKEIVSRKAPEASEPVFLDRFAFYDRAKQAYAIVASGETALYANVILKKGVVA